MKLEAGVWAEEGYNKSYGIRRVFPCYFLIINALSAIAQKVIIITKVIPFHGITMVQDGKDDFNLTSTDRSSGGLETCLETFAQSRLGYSQQTGGKGLIPIGPLHGFPDQQMNGLIYGGEPGGKNQRRLVNSSFIPFHGALGMLSHRRLQPKIMPQIIMVIQILISQAKTIDPVTSNAEYDHNDSQHACLSTHNCHGAVKITHLGAE